MYSKELETSASSKGTNAGFFYLLVMLVTITIRDFMQNGEMGTIVLFPAVAGLMAWLIYLLERRQRTDLKSQKRVLNIIKWAVFLICFGFGFLIIFA